MEKAKIKIDSESDSHPVYDKVGHDEDGVIECLFNPQEYKLNTSANYGQSSGNSSDQKEQQFIDNDADSLSVELFFDTSREKTDVREMYTEHIDLLMQTDDSDKEAPPIVNFVWGSFCFRSVVKSANKTFTRFLPDGTPVRAKVSMEFKQYGEDPQDAKKDSGGGGSEEASTWTVEKGDTLWEIAGEEYGDPTQWPTIAEENGIDDPKTLQIGTTLTIPPL